MPIFEYECRACGRLFETLVLGREEKRTPACPSCGASRTRRLPSAFAGRIGHTAGGRSCGGCTSTHCGP